VSGATFLDHVDATIGDHGLVHSGAWLSPGDLHHGRPGGRLVNETLAVCKRGDKGMHSEIVDRPGDAPACLVDQGHGVVAEERVRPAGETDMVLDVAGRLRQIHPEGCKRTVMAERHVKMPA